ncbi:MAG: winged helix-turn-helix domain-containing protein [Dehalococcoidia bacterium]|jgi:predicted DNA-binding transcriptional regulator|uniref:Winged helix-turn-helix transcriptional regulator n=1 Tax=Tepidiforma bonchosmolovskayae TaxID=2601677 RepID=A0ABX6C2V6_9CHLR|nr:winged helix-turn-helix domain-containing protein [Tepidiforma bonchosmolovskayae]MCL6644434.1 winged helix-turn-helix domain-containing protein [Dehalococcoidia bacterium]QFG03129.1 winged helix-turn-helix transcriptional regulator [Tepidiforma bonchosmolovskayae]
MGAPGWTFLTNHGHVLLCIANDPGIRLRDIAERVGITERAAQRIVADLIEAGYITRRRVGRRNIYQVHPEMPLRHPVEQAHPVGELFRLIEPLTGRSETAS